MTAPRILQAEVDERRWAREVIRAHDPMRALLCEVLDPIPESYEEERQRLLARLRRDAAQQRPDGPR